MFLYLFECTGSRSRVKIEKVLTKHWGDSTFMYYVGGKFLQYGFEKLAPSVKDDTLLKEREENWILSFLVGVRGA